MDTRQDVAQRGKLAQGWPAGVSTTNGGLVARKLGNFAAEINRTRDKRQWRGLQRVAKSIEFITTNANLLKSPVKGLGLLDRPITCTLGSTVESS